MAASLSQSAYNEVLEETPRLARERERAAFEKAIELLRLGDSREGLTAERAEAVRYVNQLWSILLEDLASAENDLPPALRARLISIGLWVLREAERLRLDGSGSFSDLIEVMEAIKKGLS